MVDTWFQLPADGSGKKMKSRSQAQGPDTVHVQYVDQDEERTYLVMALAIAPANLKSMLSLLNTSASEILEVHEASIVSAQATTAVTGVIHDFRLFRITGHSAGTATTIKPMDTSDAVPTGVDSKTGGTVSGEESTPLDRWFMSGDEFVVGTVDADWHDVWFSNYFAKWSQLASKKTKNITLRQNQGLSIKELINTAVGSFDAWFLFTAKNL